MNDKAIRNILIAYLKASNHEIRIYQEKSIGTSICDVMAVTDRLTGYEIKSDLDNYFRLAGQIKAYDRLFGGQQKPLSVCAVSCAEPLGHPVHRK